MVDCGGSIFGGFAFAKSLIDLVLNFKDDVNALKDCHNNFNKKDPKDKPINIVQSFDPNEKIGPTGIGDENYIAYQEEFSYSILFENKKDATAPAHTIVIKDTLDTDIFDLNSMVFESITIGEDELEPLPGAKNYAGQLELTDLGIVARVLSTIDVETGEVVWTFTSLDTATLAPVEDPFVGILPPNVTSPEGEGAVRFSIKLKVSPEHLLSIGNNANIFFDANAPIVTEDYINTFDLEAPSTMVDGISAVSSDTDIQLSWEGRDPESGIDRYELWISEDNGPDSLWLVLPSSATGTTFTGKNGSEYSFYTIGIDRVGNREEVPIGFDASTIITSTNDELESISVFEIYPNPSLGDFKLEVQTIETRDIHIGITDLLGRELMNIANDRLQGGILNNYNVQTTLQSGIYQIELKTDENKFVRRLVIQ
jgi:hypothetical protein